MGGGVHYTSPAFAGCVMYFIIKEAIAGQLGILILHKYHGLLTIILHNQMFNYLKPKSHRFVFMVPLLEKKNETNDTVVMKYDYIFAQYLLQL